MQSRGHSPRTIFYGHPTLSVHRRQAGVEARPYGEWGAPVDKRRDCAAPTLRQPLSHGAERRDSSPFRGAEGWVEVCGVYASVCRDADTYVSLLPVRGGVLDAPRSCYRRGGLDAPVRRDRWHPLLIRRARFRPPPNICNPAGTARAPFCTGAPTFSVIPRPGGRGSPPLRWASALHPPCPNPSVTAQSAATAPLSGEPRGGWKFAAFTHLLTTMLIPTFG